MSTKAIFLAISLAVVLLPWLAWRVPFVRPVAPLAVVQIMVGVALGPSGLGRMLPELHAMVFAPPVLGALDGLSTLAVVLYVFISGMHLDGAMLRREGRKLGVIALGSVSVPLLLGVVAGMWMLQIFPDALGPQGDRTAFVAAVAICIAVTALPVLAAVLDEMGLLRSRVGQTALALAALNDAALWVMLVVLLAFSGQGHGMGGLFSVAAAATWFGLVLVGARPWLARLAGAAPQTTLVAGVAFAMLSATVSEALGTGYLVGAFVAGAVMPAPCRVALLGALEMVTATVLLPFFFLSTGLKALIDPASPGFAGLVGVAVAATVVGKLLGTALPARRLGFSWADSLSLGAMMQTKGLMEVVVLAVLREAGLISPQLFSAMVAMAVVCTVLTAPAVRLCGGVRARGTPTPPPNRTRPVPADEGAGRHDATIGSSGT